MSVIVFGAGIAGLSAAHYLMDRGYKVTVVESLSIPGGLARSERVRNDQEMPSEYSWRGFGPWYHNTFDIMKKIPVTVDKTVYDVELSHPVIFILPSDSDENYNNTFGKSSKIGLLDKIIFSWLAIRVWASSNQRRNNVYASINASEYLGKYLSKKGAHTLSQLFGPWIGSDASRVSLHHASEFFLRNGFPGPNGYYYHDIPKPPFTQKGFTGWSLLRRPSNESWFDPWVRFLESKGVHFEFNTSLTQLHFNSNTIDYAIVNSQGISKKMIADTYVLAVNPYITRDILEKSPELLATDKQLQKFKPLVADYPHIQISFRIAFAEKINFRHTDNPSNETAMILVDSEFDITLFSQDEIWNKEVYLGDNVRSLWSGTATIDSIPGKLYGLPITKLTKDQFINEIKYQIYRCKGLDKLIMDKNNGRHLKSFPIVRIEVWHTWEFSNTPRKCTRDSNQPKWVNNTRNQKYLPTARTSIPNLYLAGAHTKTNADLYSMEAAVESGRRVADIMTNANTVIPQHVPYILRPFRSIDSILYNLGLPNIIDTFIYTLVLIFFIYYFYKIYKSIP